MQIERENLFQPKSKPWWIKFVKHIQIQGDTDKELNEFFNIITNIKKIVYDNKDELKKLNINSNESKRRSTVSKQKIKDIWESIFKNINELRYITHFNDLRKFLEKYQNQFQKNSTIICNQIEMAFSTFEYVENIEINVDSSDPNENRRVFIQKNQLFRRNRSLKDYQIKELKYDKSQQDDKIKQLWKKLKSYREKEYLEMIEKAKPKQSQFIPPNEDLLEIYEINSDEIQSETIQIPIVRFNEETNKFNEIQFEEIKIEDLKTQLSITIENGSQIVGDTQYKILIVDTRDVSDESAFYPDIIE